MEESAVKNKSPASDSVPEGASEGVSIDELKNQLEKVQKEYTEQLDRYLRAEAEMENMRRRQDEEIATVRKYAAERFVGELLNVYDSLELAQAVEIKTPDQESLERMLEGVRLTLKQFDAVFGKFSVQSIDPQGQKFDPQLHQAMSIEETDEVPPNQIVKVVRKGYLLHDRVVRPAMVIVAKSKTEKETS